MLASMLPKSKPFSLSGAADFSLIGVFPGSSKSGHPHLFCPNPVFSTIPLKPCHPDRVRATEGKQGRVEGPRHLVLYHAASGRSYASRGSYKMLSGAGLGTV
jgi:hypothetical protein